MVRAVIPQYSPRSQIRPIHFTLQCPNTHLPQPRWSRGDSNPGPPPCKGGALPTKLRPLLASNAPPPFPKVGAPGLEPGTSALSGPRSNQLSYAPKAPEYSPRSCRCVFSCTRFPLCRRRSKTANRTTVTPDSTTCERPCQADRHAVPTTSSRLGPPQSGFSIRCLTIGILP